MDDAIYITWLLAGIFIKNIVAVVAYSPLASRSQAKFHTPVKD